MRMMLLIFVILILTGCGTLNYGLTIKDDGVDYRTIYVLGFGVIHEKTDLNKIITIDDDRIIGLYYNDEQKRFGAGYYSAVYTKFLKTDEDTVMEVTRDIWGRIVINSYILHNREADKKQGDN